MMDSPNLFSIIAIFMALTAIAVSIGFGFQVSEDPQIQANQDNIGFLIETDKTLQEAIMKQTIRTVENADAVTELENYDEIITTQIGNIRQDIKNKFPMASNVPDQGSTSGASTPFLTLKMDKTEFVLGNIVIFTGTATPNNPIFITVKDSERVLTAIPVSKTEIINGAYIANYTLRLDDPIGVWEVYARQVSEQTKTITFTVE